MHSSSQLMLSWEIITSTLPFELTTSSASFLKLKQMAFMIGLNVSCPMKGLVLLMSSRMRPDGRVTFLDSSPMMLVLGNSFPALQGKLTCPFM